MKILIACEESAVVREAFKKKGHDAWSCDLEESRIPGQHIIGDVTELLKQRWDMVICFPPCTYLTVTQNKWLKDQPERKSGALVGAARRAAREVAVKFFMACVNANADKVCVENPIGCMSTRYKKPTQVIQPFWFGHKERKSTCLWLKGLPPLKPTNMVQPISFVAAGKNYSPTHYNSRRSLNRLDCLPPGKERSKLRSTTYAGIAEAMAEQWGSL